VSVKIAIFLSLTIFLLLISDYSLLIKKMNNHLSRILDHNPNSRFIGLGLVPILTAILSEMIAETMGVKTVTYLMNLPTNEPIDNKALSPAVNINIIDLSKNSFVKEPDDLFFLSVVKPSTKLAVMDLVATPLGIDYRDKDEHLFARIIHPSAYISPSATIHHGVIIQPLSSIASCAVIGRYAHIKGRVWLSHHTTIGDWVTINPSTTICSCSTVGAGTTIGAGVQIIDGVNIGAGSFIGAGSLVNKDIPDGVIAYGSPCKVQKDNNLYTKEALDFFINS
jgi:acetyltransferase-like isoleucine patch superfamily enzyme